MWVICHPSNPQIVDEFEHQTKGQVPEQLFISLLSKYGLFADNID